MGFINKHGYFIKVGSGSVENPYNATRLSREFYALTKRHSYLTPIYTNDVGTAGQDKRGVMLVKNWVFFPQGSAPPSLLPFTHLDSEIVDATGAAGQNNSNPPGGFRNHFIVKYAGKYYDPSYGTGPFNTEEDWENASIDGFEKVFRYLGLDYLVAKPNSIGLETLFIVLP